LVKAEGILVHKAGQVIAPLGLRHALMRMAHDSPAGGHYSWRASLARIKDMWFWPTMAKELQDYCVNCATCLANNPPHKRPKASLGKFEAPAFFNHRVHLDLAGPLPLDQGYRYCLVIVDAYSKFVQYVPLVDKTMDSVSKGFMDGWVTLFTIPHTVVTDLGKEFNNQLFEAISSTFGNSHRFSSPMHPQSNGQAENAVKTLITQLRKVINSPQDRILLKPSST